MPQYLDNNGNPITAPLKVYLDESGNPIGDGSSVPIPQVSAAPPSQHPVQDWLHDLDTDITSGGNRTLPGKVLGYMQGRGDEGYAGMQQGGQSKGVVDFMGSPIRGPIHAAQGIAETPQHPVMGPVHALEGGLETATIPSMFFAPEVNPVLAAAGKIPSTARAGEIFSDLDSALANHPVPLNQTLQPLQRATELGARGGTLPKPVSDLLTRSQGLEDMSYPEIRDYQSNLSDLSRDAQGSVNGKMMGQVGKIKGGLYNDIYSALEPTGRADDFAQAMKEYRQAQQLKSVAKKAAIGVGGAIAGEEGFRRFLKPLIP